MTVQTSQITDGLQELTAGVLASAPRTLGFAPSLEVRSFLIRGAERNILLNASEGALDSADAIDALGGATSLWLGHWHEAGTGAAATAERFRATVHVHAADHAEAEKTVPDVTAFDAGQIAPDIEAIHIPGHTPGSVAYLWNGPEARVLFTADSLYVKNGKLRGALLGSSDRQSYLASLRRLRDVEIDLLIPWMAEKGAPPATPYAPGGFRRDLDAVIARIEGGASG